MFSFDSYLSPDNITKQLVKIRIKSARKKHEHHLLRDISLANKTLTPIGKISEIYQIFPPRKSWTRPKEEHRKTLGSPDRIIKNSLFTSVKKHALSSDKKALWFVNLQATISLILTKLNNIEQAPLATPRCLPIAKKETGDKVECRPLALFSLADQVTIGITAKYLTDCFDKLFLPCSYAFRSTQSKDFRSHHDTVRKIQSFRKKFSRTGTWVAECDIRNFYDCIDHNLTRKLFDRLCDKAKQKGISIDPRAKRIFFNYLECYSFNNNVLPLNSDKDYFLHHRIEKGVFPAPEADLADLGVSLHTDRIGVPQGGALSCLISNIILHHIDFVLLNKRLPNTIYLRFCDDMIILSDNKTRCLEMLNIYMEQLKEHRLAIHPPKEFLVYDEEFWNSKSKMPYRWGQKSDQHTAPWVSFVGYDIRFDGMIRVRAKSLQKEIKKQKTKAKEVLNAIDYRKGALNSTSRKSRDQQLAALEMRLISMSVGKIKLYNYKDYRHNLCWCIGFRELMINPNPIIYRQMKTLDRHRSYTLSWFKKRIETISKPPENPDKKFAAKFFGSPFSYHFQFAKGKNFSLSR